MNVLSKSLEKTDNNDDYNVKKTFFKYLFFWRYILASIFFFLTVAFIVNKYSERKFKTFAKIKILDKKEGAVANLSFEDLFSNSNINLENEIEMLTSNVILNKVISKLNLTTKVYQIHEVTRSLLVQYPFSIKNNFNSDTISDMEFILEIDNNLLKINSLTDDKNYIFNDFTTTGQSHNLPFEITEIDIDKFSESYSIQFFSTSNIISDLNKNILTRRIGKKSEIILIEFISSNQKYSENIVNEIIRTFDYDGIKDRQLIHKRTIDFVNDRFLYLSSELDSIEIDKLQFKEQNNFIDLETNSNISLKKSSTYEESVFSNENQIYLVSSLLDIIPELNYKLLPSNIGIESKEINTLINLYNDLILKKNKLVISAGPNHPSVKQLENTISESKSNIIFSLKNYLFQLENLENKLYKKFNKYYSQVDKLPEKEKTLRSIERNQQVKEALYLILLEKREEAEVNYAITEPSIKIIDYVNTSIKPIYPNSFVIFFVSILFGFFLPIIILSLIFYFDNKIHSREDLEEFSLNIVGEIPFFDMSDSNKLFNDPNDRSIISESFRMLMSNIRYLLNNDLKSNVILVTSSIKGEGKTLNALNLALSFSSVGKKVLIIGCDLRNPQLHKYIDYDKNVPGLVDFLVDNKVDWKKNILKPFKNQSLNVLLSGPLPPNPLNLINNNNIDILLNEARKLYDYVIIDTAPTLLVADTMSLIDKSDVLVFLARVNVTDKNILKYISNTTSEVDVNVGVILNGIGQKNSYGYNYGYKYGYGYKYKYSYNYGYGYGYSADDEKS